MPFEPKLVSPDDGPEPGQSDPDLPADLAALADQLRIDADRLAVRYPADWIEGEGGLAVSAAGRHSSAGTGSSAEMGLRPAKLPRAAWFSAVAAAAVLVLAAGWGVWRLTTTAAPDDLRTANHGNDDNSHSLRSEAGIESVASRTEAEPVLPALPAEDAQTLLMHVNGPELEGMVDLLETQRKEAPLLSI